MAPALGMFSVQCGYRKNVVCVTWVSLGLLGVFRKVVRQGVLFGNVQNPTEKPEHL
jgi:hypothetical protein